MLLVHKANVDSKEKRGNSPLHVAALTGHKDVAEVLLANGADVNARTGANTTPLHIAADFGHRDVAALLLANKADVNARDGGGETPLYAAALSGHADVAELLLAKGADVNARTTENGWMPLHWARTADVVKVLLTNKADANARAGNGLTPLDCAIYYALCGDQRLQGDCGIAPPTRWPRINGEQGATLPAWTLTILNHRHLLLLVAMD